MTRGYPDIDIRRKGYGRFRKSAGSAKREVVERRKGYIRTLLQNGQLGVLRALANDELTWPQIEEAAKLKRLNDEALLADIKVRAKLFPAIDGMLDRLGKRPETRAWYERTLGQLRTVGFTDTDRVQDLNCDDWPERLAKWDVSPARKNGLRRAVSRFLSRYLGDKFHPFRRSVLHEDKWPILKQRKKLRGMSVEVFWSLMARVPYPECVHAYITLAVSGMRVGELLNDKAIQLDHQNYIIYPEGKTGPGAYAVDPRFWGFVQASVPCRVMRPSRKTVMIHNDPRYRRLYRVLKDAAEAFDVDVTLHDFRRLYAREGEKALGLVATQTALGHTTAAMTAQYAAANTRASVAEAVGTALVLARPRE